MFELLERVGHPLQRISGCDGNLDRARRDEARHLGEDLGSGGGAAAVGLDAELLGLLKRSNGLDSVT